MEKISRRAGVALALLAILALWPGPAGLLAQTPASTTEIVVGYAVPISGGLSVVGRLSDQAHRLWVEHVNAQGGILVKELGKKLPVRVIVYDSRSTTSDAQRMYEKLIAEDKVHFVLGAWGSADAFAVSVVTERHGYPFLPSAASAEGIYQRGFKTVFQLSQRPSQTAEAIAEFLTPLKGQIKTVAVAQQNYVYTNDIMEVLEPKLKSAGFDIVAKELFPRGSQEFTGVITKVKAAQPDAFLVIAVPPDFFPLPQQAETQGVKAKLKYSFLGPVFDAWMKAMGKGSEGWIESPGWAQGMRFPGAENFEKDFAAKYGVAASHDAAWAYAGDDILRQAIEKAGTLDRKKVLEVLHKESFTTINGTYKWDASGRAELLVPFTQVQGGKRVIVWPKSIATGELVLGK